MEKVLDELVRRLTKTYGERLVSIMLYGSAAAGDYAGPFSDLNIFCVLQLVTLRELQQAEMVFRWWRSLDNPGPLLMTKEEVHASTDCFPMEFHDIQEQNRVLYGVDVTAGLEIDDSFYRAQVEYQFRAKVLRLRQKGAGIIKDRELLLRLLTDSVSTFCVLSRHALRLHGLASKWQKREIIEQVREKFGIDREPFVTLLDLREQRIKPRSVDPVPLYEKYLKEIQVVVDAVDRLEK